MRLDSISITNYRNIRSSALSFSPKINCLIGDNGEGKTNLLDAISYLSFCRSNFAAADSAVVTHGADFFTLRGHYSGDDGVAMEEITATFSQGRRKRFRRGEKDYKRLSEHIGLIPLVFVTPADNALVEGDSERRRRLMDVTIAQHERPYMELLGRYDKALKQRNVLLKQDDEPDSALMDILEEEMAARGEEVYQKRARFIAELEPLFQEFHHRISGQRENVSLQYVSHCQRGPLLDVIRRDRAKDRAVGYSLHGVHRDDLELLLDGYPMKREASQGQTKTCALALKLAQFAWLRQTVTRTTPILLLDDIFDKLDASRVELLVRLVSEDSFGQIFITDTNRGHLDQILRHGTGDYRLFHVKGGEINVQA